MGNKCRFFCWCCWYAGRKKITALWLDNVQYSVWSRTVDWSRLGKYDHLTAPYCSHIRTIYSSRECYNIRPSAQQNRTRCCCVCASISQRYCHAAIERRKTLHIITEIDTRVTDNYFGLYKPSGYPSIGYVLRNEHDRIELWSALISWISHRELYHSNATVTVIGVIARNRTTRTAALELFHCWVIQLWFRIEKSNACDIYFLNRYSERYLLYHNNFITSTQKTQTFSHSSMLEAVRQKTMFKTLAWTRSHSVGCRAADYLITCVQTCTCCVGDSRTLSCRFLAPAIACKDRHWYFFSRPPQQPTATTAQNLRKQFRVSVHADVRFAARIQSMSTSVCVYVACRAENTSSQHRRNNAASSSSRPQHGHRIRTNIVWMLRQHTNSHTI